MSKSKDGRFCRRWQRVYNYFSDVFRSELQRTVLNSIFSQKRFVVLAHFLWFSSSLSFGILCIFHLYGLRNMTFLRSECRPYHMRTNHRIVKNTLASALQSSVKMHHAMFSKMPQRVQHNATESVLQAAPGIGPENTSQNALKSSRKCHTKCFASVQMWYPFRSVVEIVLSVGAPIDASRSIPSNVWQHVV